jgi:hypothetical protein
VHPKKKEREPYSKMYIEKMDRGDVKQFFELNAYYWKARRISELWESYAERMNAPRTEYNLYISRGGRGEYVRVDGAAPRYVEMGDCFRFIKRAL